MTNRIEPAGRIHHAATCEHHVEWSARLGERRARRRQTRHNNRHRENDNASHAANIVLDLARREREISAMLRFTAFLAAGVAASAITVRSAQETIALTPDRLTLKGVVADNAQHMGRPALRLLEADKSRTNAGVAIINGLTFRDGTLEVEVAGRRGPYAVPDDRGFIGLAFRITPNAERFEYIYLRPDNGRAADQVRRNHSTQYSSHPDFSFARLRKEAPEKYESYVDLEYGVWTRMKIVVAGTTARLFVHDAPQPALVVNDLKLGAGEGAVGLFIGSGTEGFFSNFRVTR
jgi:hypothetical protein